MFIAVMTSVLRTPEPSPFSGLYHQYKPQVLPNSVDPSERRDNEVEGSPDNTAPEIRGAGPDVQWGMEISGVPGKVTEGTSELEGPPARCGVNKGTGMRVLSSSSRAARCTAGRSEL